MHTIRADITRPEAIEGIVHEALERFGRVDMLINAAAARRFSPLLADDSEADAARVFAVNVLAPLRLSLSLARACWRADAATNLELNRNVLNVGSTAGLYVYPDTGQALYASSKAALHHLTYHLASEFWDLARSAGERHRSGHVPGLRGDRRGAGRHRRLRHILRDRQRPRTAASGLGSPAGPRWLRAARC